MKALFIALIVVAVANFIATLGFVGWLVQSDRLDMERIRELRTRLTVTITQQKAAADADAKKAEEAAKAAEAAAKAAKPPLTASEQLAARLEATELDKERLARLRRDVESLQKRLADQTAQLAKERADLAEERRVLAGMNSQSVDKVAQEQFVKSLNVLSSMKPAAAKSILSQMLSGQAPDPAAAAPIAAAPSANGRPPATGQAPVDAKAQAERMRKVVQYLDAMEDRVRTNILGEFAKDDAAMASQLLEHLRDKGKPQGPAAPTRTASGSP
ncbi:MAG: hypothetical protein WCK33_06970 [Phycisphaerae bacterium]